jgi:O-antigen/teichoic acid export membrane protein
MSQQLQFSARRFAIVRRRLSLVITNSLNSLLLPLFNVLISLWVVRLASVDLWGAFVELLIVAQLGAHVLAWGNKEYLLRAFSFDPGRVILTWRSNLLTRLALFPAFALIVMLLSWSPVQMLLLMLWTLGLMLCQSFEVLIVYRRAFVASIWIELGAIAVMLAVITVLGARLTLDGLLLLFAGVTLGKAAALALSFRQESLAATVDSVSWQGRLDFSYFGAALPFFLLGFSGMLQSRIDLYSVSLFLPEREVGQYQVFINLMIYLQAIANFVLMPFVKSLYRLDYGAIGRVSVRLLGLGVLLAPPALLGVNWLLSRVYAIDLPPLFLLLGALYVLPVYYYLPTIYGLYKADRQNTVLWVNLSGCALNLLLSLFLVQHMGAIGALLAATLVQWFVLGCYVNRQIKGHASERLVSAMS